MTYLTELPARGVIEVSGEDRVSFLQGLVSNDVEQAAPGRAVWAGLLTPQGKYLADFFILTAGDALLLDCEQSQIPMLVLKLSRFRLRAKVAILPRDDLRVGVAWGGDAPTAAIVAPDPRLPDAGWRLISAQPFAANATPDDWDRHRLALSLPDGTSDLEVDKTVLLEAGFDELGGHDPLARLLAQGRAGVHVEADAARAQVMRLGIGLHTDVAEQAGEQGAMDLLEGGGRGVEAPVVFLGQLHQLAVHVAPLAQAQGREEVLPAGLREFAIRQRVADLVEVVPDFHEA